VVKRLLVAGYGDVARRAALEKGRILPERRFALWCSARKCRRWQRDPHGRL